MDGINASVGVGAALFMATSVAAAVSSRVLSGASSKKEASGAHDSKFMYQSPLIARQHNAGDPYPLPGTQAQDVIDYYLNPKKAMEETTAWEEEPAAVDSKDVGTPDDWIKRHPDLVRLTGRHPFNCEPLLKDLFRKGFITPTSLHYVRTHGATPKASWDNHKIFIGGLAPNPMQLTMSQLTQMPLVSMPVTLVCCGNRRKEQNMIKQTKGFNWGAAGVSNGVWTGVPLHEILKLSGITREGGADFKYVPNRYHIRFASEADKGGDNLPGGVYGTSVPLEKAMDPAMGIIVAFMYNGRLLSVDHGFPVRIIIPGYIGGRMIKWMTNIDLLDTISRDYYHFYDNRVMPPHVDAELATLEDWWHKPEYICNELNINSAIAAPNHDDEIDVDDSLYTLAGYAYTGGGRLVTRCEISLDSGASWLTATLKVHEKPTDYGKYWCWVFWELQVRVSELAECIEVVLRAWDESTNVQPALPTWNLMGMLNNPWFRIKIHQVAAESNMHRRIRFEHPTMAGNTAGGWMARMKGHPSLTTPGIYLDPDSAAATIISTTEPLTSGTSDASISGDSFDATKPSYTLEEVAMHDTPESAWFITKGKVYDATPFLDVHPGGSSSILIEAGTDCTESFEAIHSAKAWKMLDKYYIGELRPVGYTGPTNRKDAAIAASTTRLHNDAVTPVEESKGIPVALNPKQRVEFTCIFKKQLSSDSYLLRFALQTPETVLGLPVGQHMLVSAKVDEKLVIRAYTPTSSDLDVGHFDLVIKAYHPNKEYQEGGKMSQHLANLSVGDMIGVKGPLGHVTYLGRGVLRVDKTSHNIKNFIMLCAGTGITPIYQVLCDVLRNPSDPTVCYVLFANRYEEDILLKEELLDLAAKHPDRCKLKLMLSQPRRPEAWKGLKGRVNLDALRSFIPAGGAGTGNFALLCGPDGFMHSACDPALSAMGYTSGPQNHVDCAYF